MEHMGTIGAVASGILKNEKARNILSKFFHKIYKRMMLKPVKCVVINDVDRLNLKFKYQEEVYQYLDVEAVYLSLLSDSDIAKLSQLKKLNPRSWVLAVKKPCKNALNMVRNQWRKETVILIVSNMELAKELHVKDITMFVQDKEFHKTMSNSVDETTFEYLDKMKDNYLKYDHIEYKSHEQLVEKLERLFQK